MFGTLLESRATLQSHSAGSFVSIIVHTAIITGAVMLTAREVIETPVATRLVTVRFSQPDAPPPPRPTLTTAAIAAVNAAPSPFTLRIPSIVPVGVPPIDFGATPTPVDFTPGRVGRDGMTCERDCQPGPMSDVEGRQLWSNAELMMRLREDPVPPRYPEGLRRAGVEGSVLVKFVVDTTGRVDMRSVEVMRSTHEAFTAAVRETLERLRFQPSSSGERKVKAVAMMPFQFTLR